MVTDYTVAGWRRADAALGSGAAAAMAGLAGAAVSAADAASCALVDPVD